MDKTMALIKELEELIDRERNPELKEALIDLDEFLFRY